MKPALHLLLASLVVGLALGCGSGDVVGQGSPIQNAHPERCDNGKDDDGDGQVDCMDADCATQAPCPGAMAISGHTPGEPPFNECYRSEGDRSQTPVDMVWILDSSASMKQELAWIESQLNEFANRLLARRADIRFALLGGPTMCVQPPLGGTNCGDAERFVHVKEYIGNDDTLPMAITLFDEYKDILRSNAKRMFIAVSDDNPAVNAAPSEWPNGITAEAFDLRLRSLGNGMFSSYVFNSIVAYSDHGRHPRGCITGTAPGDTYLALTQMTSGLKFSICNPDWRDVFTQLGEAVAAMTNVPCSYPRAVVLENGMTTNDDFLQVEAEVDGRWQVLGQVKDATGCSGNQPGWYVDDTRVHLCPSVCESTAVTRSRVLHGCPIQAPD